MPSRLPSSETVRIAGLAVDYRGSNGLLRVLEGVDLVVQAGEILGVIGPSGCGKTTLLGAVMGLIRPSAGTVAVAARSVAMVFQRPQLFPWRTVVANAAYGLECRGVPTQTARARAAALLESMHLGPHLEDHPHRLSEGMKQRVNLARALLVEPELLLMDEPYSALDVVTRRELEEDLLARWQERRFTVLFASHSLEEIIKLADRVAALRGKPSRISALLDVDLPRPRGVGATGMTEMFARVEKLEELLS